MILNEQIVKVIGTTSGHNYRAGEFYKMSKLAPTSAGSVRLLEIIKIPGISFSGNNIRPSDFEHIDVFSDNEEFTAFIKRKEELIFNQLLADLKVAILFKEESKRVIEFSSKDDYIIDCITKCKDGLSDDEDERCKQIVSLLASLT